MLDRSDDHHILDMYLCITMQKIFQKWKIVFND